MSENTILKRKTLILEFSSPHSARFREMQNRLLSHNQKTIYSMHEQQPGKVVPKCNNNLTESALSKNPVR
jgi:hypothetical protein